MKESRRETGSGGVHEERKEKEQSVFCVIDGICG
jgi:hypothetical protein